MRLSSIFSVGALSLFLAGCTDTFSDLKDAAAGINSAANQAATALSQDVHAMRSVEVEYGDVTFTLNDLFKQILRDVQWHYDAEQATDTLKVTGTWQPDLFSSYAINEASFTDLSNYGEVTVLLTIENNHLMEDQTSVSLLYNGEILLEAQGQEILHALLKEYVEK